MQSPADGEGLIGEDEPVVGTVTHSDVDSSTLNLVTLFEPSYPTVDRCCDKTYTKEALLDLGEWMDRDKDVCGR